MGSDDDILRPASSSDRQLLTKVIRDLGVIKRDIETMDRRLFGNGQPGEIEKLHEELAKKADQSDFDRIADTVRALERLRWQLIGACSLLLLGYQFLQWFIPLLMKGKV